MNCRHEMEYVKTTEEYYWEGDFYHVRINDNYECSKCGSAESVYANDKWLNEVIL